jgi:CubicO group peptidase (beta-lactamase class C family)
LVGDDFRGSCLVTQGDRVLLEIHAGARDGDPSNPIGPTTAFQIASLSKEFMAAVVLRFRARGELSIGDPIGRWLAVPQSWRSITVGHLLSHTSGLGHWFDYKALNLYKPMAADALTEILLREPLRFAPGADWYYSSPGYALLARIIEQVTAQPFSSVVADEVLRPLGLVGTAVGSAGSLSRASGFDHAKPVRPFELDSVCKGAGDIWSTATDLESWTRAIATGSLLAARSVKEMLSCQNPVKGVYALEAGTCYGYGWFVGTLRGRSARYHMGDNPGFKAFNAWLPQDDIAVVVLSNEDTTNATAVALELLDAAIS